MRIFPVSVKVVEYHTKNPPVDKKKDKVSKTQKRCNGLHGLSIPCSGVFLQINVLLLNL